LLKRYKYGIIYYQRFKTNKNWKKLGKESSLIIHYEILKDRNILMRNGHYFIVGFGAGSCKLCNSCFFPCRQPDKSFIPFEGTGVNVKALMKKFKIDLKFPVNKNFYRVGVIFYD